MRKYCPSARFLPTPSARRATFGKAGNLPQKRDFYPRPPRGGRPLTLRTIPAPYYFYPRPPRGGRQVFMRFYPYIRQISTHALREEGDPKRSALQSAVQRFLPTPSARRATAAQRAESLAPTISTHALREEGDGAPTAGLPSDMDFYPRPPRGGRPLSTLPGSSRPNFYPRPPRGGRPSSRAPRASRSSDFYPRPPRGGRRHRHRRDRLPGRISTHALREEGDARREVMP